MALATLHPSPAMAGKAVVRLGDASIRYDDARWRVSTPHDALHFEPVATTRPRLDPVTVRRVQTDEPCRVIAEGVFGFGLYDEHSIKHGATRIGGIAGELYTAHTRCRNATPVGVVVCVRANARTYLVQSVQAGCTGRNLFSGVDPLAELAGGMTFAEPER